MRPIPLSEHRLASKDGFTSKKASRYWLSCISVSFFARLPLGWLYLVFDTESSLHGLWTKILYEGWRTQLSNNKPINVLNKRLVLTLNFGVGASTFSWILSKELDCLGRYLSSCMKANQALQEMVASATLSTPSVAASGATTVWANGPAGPPHFFNWLLIPVPVKSLKIPIAGLN